MKPWYRPPSDGHGPDEIVGPGGLIQIGLTGDRVLDHARIACALAPLCESPIEVSLGTWLVRQLAGTDLVSVPQYRWQRWRMDFALKRGDEPRLFIECDGRDFHSTPEQIENDRRKDVAAAQAGIPLMRFTGSDIFHDPRTCAALAIERARRRDWGRRR